jgi:predicted CoA-binding protein
VVGVSDRRDTGCNAAYERFKQAGYHVQPVNPRLSEYDGSPCYPDLTSIPEKPDAVFILANPEITDQIVEECTDLGIRYVWMHCMMGTKPGLAASITSVSQDAVQKCRDHGINVIPGSYPKDLSPDIGHAMVRAIFRTLGFMRVASPPTSDR